MDALKVLEEKLVRLSHRARELIAENTALSEEAKELKTENAKIAEENAQLTAKLAMLENALQDDSRRIDELKHEKQLTKLVVDDLIKSIDAIVENQS